MGFCYRSPIQVAIVQALENGVYLIQSTDRRHAFGFYTSDGDAPLRLLQARHQFIRRWIVKSVSPSEYTIIDEDNQPYGYKMVPDDKNVIASEKKASFAWTVTKAGSELYTIQAPNKDLLITGNADSSPLLHLEQANGSDNQRWIFKKIDPRYDSYHKKGSHNRFCAQELW
ncbi:hypothetical protein BGZ73_000815 [Actinomortierella ambigua]|nr:hypothetical protein BGZ73_000815 [Actinomortierella ambigua]